VKDELQRSVWLSTTPQPRHPALLEMGSCPRTSTPAVPTLLLRHTAKLPSHHRVKPSIQPDAHWCFLCGFVSSFESVPASSVPGLSTHTALPATPTYVISPLSQSPGARWLLQLMAQEQTMQQVFCCLSIAAHLRGCDRRGSTSA